VGNQNCETCIELKVNNWHWCRIKSAIVCYFLFSKYMLLILLWNHLCFSPYTITRPRWPLSICLWRELLQWGILWCPHSWKKTQDYNGGVSGRSEKVLTFIENNYIWSVFVLCNFSFFKTRQQHYTLRNGENVKKHNRTPLRLAHALVIKNHITVWYMRILSSKALT